MKKDAYIQVLPVGAFDTNCIIIHAPGSDVLYVVDPGDEAELLKTAADSAKKACECTEVRVMLTHPHADHIQACGPVVKAFGCEGVYLDPADKFIYDNPANACLPYIPAARDLPPTLWPPDDPDVQVIACPGHSPGGSAYYFKSMKTLLSGDTLFRMSIGRTDLFGGSDRDILSTLRHKLLVLPDETRVIAGHGPETTIGYEKQYNPFA